MMKINQDLDLLFSKSAPQLIHVLFWPIDIAPQFAHVLIFDLKELKPKKTKINNKTGIKNKRIMILPRKLIKKLTPKSGIAISISKE